MISTILALYDGESSQTHPPNDQRILPEATLLQILYESRNGLVSSQCIFVMTRLQVPMLIPNLATAHCNEPNPGFGKSSCEKTTPPERFSFFLLQTICLMRCIGLKSNIKNFGSCKSHSRSKIQPLQKPLGDLYLSASSRCNWFMSNQFKTFTHCLVTTGSGQIGNGSFTRLTITSYRSGLMHRGQKSCAMIAGSAMRSGRTYCNMSGKISMPTAAA